jgi:O-methyltransferase
LIAGDTRLQLTRGTFLLQAADGLRLGNVSMPNDLWLVGPDLASVVARLASPQQADRLLERVPPAHRAAFAKAVDELREMGLVSAAEAEGPSEGELRTLEFELTRHSDVYRDISATAPGFLELYYRVQPYTLTSVPLAFGLYEAVRYIAEADIPGAIVECGVWRGGSMLLAALALLELNKTDRQLWLYDTFAWEWESAGDTDGYVFEPESDSAARRSAAILRRDSDEDSVRAGTSVDEVVSLIIGAGYPAENVIAVPGLVQDTLPETAPTVISLLRLDTDMAESTSHELMTLYPRLSVGGVLLVDDYGKHRGATMATEAFFLQTGQRPLLTRLDIQGRIAIKVGYRPDGASD